MYQELMHEAAVEAYRLKLATIETKTDISIGTQFTLKESHLFRRNAGYISLDITRSRNSAWKIPQEFDY